MWRCHVGRSSSSFYGANLKTSGRGSFIRTYLAQRLAADRPKLVDRLQDSDFSGIQAVLGHISRDDFLSARSVFDELNHSDPRLWNAGIAAFSGHGRADAFTLFRQMLYEGILPTKNTYITVLKECKQALHLPQAKLVEALCSETGLLVDSMVGSSVVNMYGNCRSYEDARRVFDALAVRTVVAWTAIIHSCSDLGGYSDALCLFHQAQLEGVEMDRPFFLIVLGACTSAQDLETGVLVHSFLQQCGLDTGLLLGNTLINMYGVCGDVGEARKAFEIMEERNLVSWNVLLAGYVKQGVCDQAILLFHQMQLEGTKPESVTFLAALDVCATMEDVDLGKRVHSMVQESAVALQVHDSIINMYGKCGYLKDASRVFEALQQRQVVSWNTIICSYAQHSFHKEAVQLFQRMQLEGCKPDRVTILNVLNGCASPEALPEGELIHGCIAGTEHEADPVVETGLVNMYSRCGRLEAACEIFRDISPQDIICCTTVVWASVKYGYLSQALSFLRYMQLNGVLPNMVTLISGLNACGCRNSLNDGLAIESWVTELGGRGNVFVGTALCTMYGKCKSLEAAQEVFDRMQDKDLVAWNSMMTLCTGYGRSAAAMMLFRMMQQLGLKVNRFTFPIILAAAETSSLAEQLHFMVNETEYRWDDGVLTSLVSLYGKLGCLEKAREVFDGAGSNWTVALWTSVISAYADQGNSEEAGRLLGRMQLEGFVPNSVTLASLLTRSSLAETELLHDFIRQTSLEVDPTVCNALIETYGSHGRIEEARKLFDSLQSRTAMSWSSTIEAYAAHGLEAEGLRLYHQMLLEGCVPDEVIFVAVLGASAALASLRHGKAIHAQLVEKGLQSELLIATALVNMYGKSGSLDDARAVFNSVAERDTIIWNTMMAALAQHEAAKSDEVLKLLWLMEQDGTRTERTTFISVLTACSHAGGVEKALAAFHLMRLDYGLVPSLEHYGCLVDLLGRAGKLEAAEKLILSSPFQSASRLWMTLLSACKSQDDMSRAERAAQNAIEFDPQNPAAYVVLASIYAAAGRWEDEANVKRALKELQFSSDSPAEVP